MTLLYIVLGLLTVLALLWYILFRPQRKHPGWSSLTGFRYAHRGLHDVASGIPENSIPAFRAALDRGFAVEIDLHLMADGKLAVFHDNSLQRVCGVDVKVEDLTADALKDYPLLGGNGDCIPLFEDVLAMFERGTPLLIELKTDRKGAPALTDAVMAALADWKGAYTIQSFEPAVISHLRKRYPHVIRGLLDTYFLRAREHKSRWRAYYVIKNWLMCTVQTRPDYISHMWQDPAAPDLKRMCRRQGIRLFSWTVRDEETMLKLEAEGCIPIFEGFVPGMKQ